jgi:putative Mg2+ transporter-C (MgtC) family protein
VPALSGLIVKCGGAILRRDNSVKGTATAASLWITGAIGVAVGLGSFDVALLLSIATIVTLWLLPALKPITNDNSGPKPSKK